MISPFSSVLHEPRSRRPLPEALYQKPREICAFSRRWDEEPPPAEVSRYVEVRKRRIEMEVARLGVRLHTPGPRDLDAILRFSLSFGNPAVRALSAYDLYRVLRCGRPLVLLGPGGEILGYDLTAEYSDGEEKTLATCGYAVSPALAGHNLGAKMVTYSALRGLAAGASVRRGIVSPRNIKSLATLLNHLGCVCDGFVREFGNWGEPRFTHACRLTPAGLSNNRIDPRKLAAFLATAEEGTEYRLLRPGDDAGLQRLYRDTPFRVAAILPPGLANDGDNADDATAGGATLLAVPVSCEE
jgi:hypothetical protein